MDKLFLAPCASKRPQQHFRNSIQQGVPYATYSKYTNRNFGASVSIWAVTPGLKSTWAKISPGDIVLFYLGNLEYRYAVEVLDTEQNLELALEIWPDYSDKSAGGGDTIDPWEYVIYTSPPVEINLDSNLLHKRAGHERMYPFKFAPYPDNRYDALLQDFGTVRSFVSAHETGFQSQFRDTESQQSTDFEENTRDVRPPKRTETTVSRVIRNTALAKDLKELYDYECQICGLRLQRSEDLPYAEAHHLHPLGDLPPGLDVKGNIMVLCPNHHAEFDYGMIKIDPETLEIEHAYEDSGGGTDPKR